jgi:hypothetical protein
MSGPHPDEPWQYQRDPACGEFRSWSGPWYSMHKQETGPEEPVSAATDERWPVGPPTRSAADEGHRTPVADTNEWSIIEQDRWFTEAQAIAGHQNAAQRWMEAERHMDGG